MKTLIPMIPIITALALFEGTARCEEFEEAVQEFSAAAQQSAVEAAKQVETAQRQFEQMDSQFASALDQYRKLAQAATDARVYSEGAVPGELFGQRGGTYQGKTFGRRSSSGPDKALVVRSADTDSAAQANLEEDLTVMLRVFDKAIDGLRGNKTAPSVLGINVYFSPGTMPNRSLYLDGYGALFLLKVDFPLLAPPVAKDEQKEKPATDSSWEQARRELYGSSDNGAFVRDADQYDADKVAKLKNTLSEAFKSAANVRNLKPDDSITVCVFGGAGQRVVEQTAVDALKMKLANTSISIENGPGRGSILTLRAKKSDVDAYAKGKLNLEEFRKKTIQTVYQGGGTGMW